MQEWENSYNSFNSNKGFAYKQWYDAIRMGNFLPPVEANIDPVNNCNLNCVWCNAKNVINRKEKEMMTRKHLLDLIKFLGNWGVKGVCFAGGGEPTMHPDLADAFRACTNIGLKSSIITNGLFREDQIEAIAHHARWIGISVGASSPATFEKCKGWNKFNDVIENIRTISALGTKELTYKFLIHPQNQYEIYDACKLAKQLNCHRFHARPLAFLCYQSKEEKYDIKVIEEQFQACHKLNSDRFEVITPTHKYDKDFHREINFRKCKASPLIIILEANGDVNVCLDRKGDPKTRLCSHENIEVVRQVWGSKRHKKLLNKINPKKDCPKCTYGKYNEQYEALINDKMCWEFP